MSPLRQAIILAAGKGTRLSKYTKNVPKCFLPIKYGQTIIERMIHQLMKNGIRDIVVVLGFKEKYGKEILHEILSTTKDLRIREATNAEYEHTGTLKSLLIAKEYLPYPNEDFMLIEGDVICDDEIIQKIANSNDNFLAVDSSSHIDDESMKYTLAEGDKIGSISKKIVETECDGEFIGISFFCGQTWSQFAKNALRIDLEIPDAFYEEVIHQAGLDFRALDIYPHKWTEVDFPAEYKKARYIFAQEEKIEIDHSLFEQTSHTPSILSIAEDLDIEIHDFCYLANPYVLNEELIQNFSIELKQLISTYPPLQSQLSEMVSAYHDHLVLPENIIVGNGASELISILNDCITGSIVPIPTFSEYIDRTRNVLTYQLQEKNKFDIEVEDFIEFCKKHSPKSYPNIILINPNNPVGRVLTREEVVKIATGLKSHNVVVDESFIEFSEPSYSVLDLYNEFKNLIIIKSFGKILGMPGIRLGALYSNLEVINKLKSKTPVWNVNSLGAYVLRLMSDPDFKLLIDESCDMTKKDTFQLYSAFKKIEGLLPYKPAANFVFVKLLIDMSSTEMRDKLLEDRILVRDCSNKIGLYPKFLRIASRKEIENRKLVRHLQMLLAENSREQSA